MLRNTSTQTIRHVTQRHPPRLGALDAQPLYIHYLATETTRRRTHSRHPTDAFALRSNDTIASIFEYAQQKAVLGVSIGQEESIQDRPQEKGASRGKRRRTLKTRRYRPIIRQIEVSANVAHKALSDRVENRELRNVVRKYVLPLRSKELARRGFDIASGAPTTALITSTRKDGLAPVQFIGKRLIRTDIQRLRRDGRPYEIRKSGSLRIYRPIRRGRARQGDYLARAILRISSDPHFRRMEGTKPDGTLHTEQCNAVLDREHSARQIRNRRRRHKAKEYALLYSQKKHQPDEIKTGKESMNIDRADPFDLLQSIAEGLGPAPLESTATGEDKTSEESQDPIWGDMPLSPLMHPELLAARNKYQTKKSPPSKDPTEFEARVARNPFGKSAGFIHNLH